MNPKILAKLVAKSCDMEPSIPSTSKDGITQADVAASLASLREGQYLLMRMKWVDDKCRDQCNRLIDYAKKELRPYFQEWKTNGTEETMLICMALSEIVHPHKCPECEGKGIIYHKRGVIEDCSHCNGRGLRSKTKKSLADQAGIPYTTWVRKWHRRYLYVFRMFLGWEDSAIYKIKKSLR